MAALEWFESIARLRKRLARLEDAIESAYAAAGPHGQQIGSVGGGGGGDAFAGIDNIVDSNAVVERDRCKAELDAQLEQATNVLYGKSGRGGLAKATCTDDADMLCFHYLQGESWASIGRRFNPDAANLTVWCKTRAKGLCRQIDLLGIDELENS